MKNHINLIILFLSVYAAPKTFVQAMANAGELASAKTYYNVQEALAQKAEVYNLNIRQQSYYQLPAEVGELVNLQFINAMKNKITAISPAIGKLQ